MCLTLRKKFLSASHAMAESKPLIAQRDIKVYKVLNKSSGGKFTSPHQGTRNWVKGKSKKAKKFGLRPRDYFNQYCEMQINEGLHANINLRAAIADWGKEEARPLIEMIIPKGTPFFIGCSNDIVALELLWPKKMPNNTCDARTAATLSLGG